MRWMRGWRAGGRGIWAGGPPIRPTIIGSTTVSANWVATAASMALPPAASISMPAADANGWLEATMPALACAGRFSQVNCVAARSRQLDLIMPRSPLGFSDSKSGTPPRGAPSEGYASRSKIAPARDPLDADGDYGKLGDLHGGKLWIARPQHRLRLIVLDPDGQDLRPSVQHDPGETPPILVIVVEYDGHSGIFDDVAQPFQRPATIALRLLVDRDIEETFRQDKPDRNDVGDRVAVGGRQVTDPSSVQEVTLAIR